MPQGDPSQPPSDFGPSSLWSAFGVRGRKPPASEDDPPREAQATVPGGSRRLSAPDDVRAVFWGAYAHLFPPHAIVTQNDKGALVISWSMQGDPHARFRYAAPVVLRFEPELIEMMTDGSPDTRKRIAAQQEANVRAGLLGYDPYAGAQARIIVLG
ncbi:hypothetical protein [Ramlibacter sp.]|uniref:hypothetical protein n=1 Tax=Ramlibacter sp. TaxID=1917967 RepID=UPI003D0F57AA